MIPWVSPSRTVTQRSYKEGKFWSGIEWSLDSSGNRKSSPPRTQHSRADGARSLCPTWDSSNRQAVQDAPIHLTCSETLETAQKYFLPKACFPHSLPAGVRSAWGHVGSPHPLGLPSLYPSQTSSPVSHLQN